RLERGVLRLPRVGKLGPFATLGRQGLPPRERVADRVRHRTISQPCRDRLVRVDIVLSVLHALWCDSRRDPRYVRAKAESLEELEIRDPGQRTLRRWNSRAEGVLEFSHRDHIVAGDVERSGSSILEQMNHERGEVANVRELHVIVRITGNEYFA